MESLDEIKARAEAAVPGAKIDIVPNSGPANQPSLLVDNEHAPAIAFLAARQIVLQDPLSLAHGQVALVGAESQAPTSLGRLAEEQLSIGQTPNPERVRSVQVGEELVGRAKPQSPTRR